MTRFLPLALFACSFPVTIRDHEPERILDLDFGVGQDLLSGPYAVGSTLTFDFPGRLPDQVRSMNPGVFRIDARTAESVTGTVLAAGPFQLELVVDGRIERWVDLEAREAVRAELIPNAARRAEVRWDATPWVVQDTTVTLMVQPIAADGTPLAGSLPVAPQVVAGDGSLTVEVGASALPTAVHVSTGAPGTLEVDLGVNVVPLEVVADERIDAVTIHGSEARDEGAVTELWAVGYSGTRPILGGEVTWLLDGNERGEGDLYNYEVDPSVTRRLTARIGDVEASREVHGLGSVRSSGNVSGCSTVASPLDLGGWLRR